MDPTCFFSDPCFTLKLSFSLLCDSEISAVLTGGGHGVAAPGVTTCSFPHKLPSSNTGNGLHQGTLLDVPLPCETWISPA